MIFSEEIKVINDISNYDADVDFFSGQNWAVQFIEDGVDGVVVGSQWPSKSRMQLSILRDSSMPIVGTYAEPGVESAISLAREFGARRVGIACEPGSITSRSVLEDGISLVMAADLRPWLYGNVGDLIAIAGLDIIYSSDVDVWLASYGANSSDPNNQKAPIRTFDFGRGQRALVAHQFNSTIVEAGRNRDHSYWYEEIEELGTMALQQDFDKLVTRIAAGSERRDINGNTLPFEARLAIARDWLNDQEPHQSTHDMAASAIALAQEALKVGGVIHDGMSDSELQDAIRKIVNTARVVV